MEGSIKVGRKIVMGKVTIQEIAKVLIEKNHFEAKDASRFVNEMFSIIMEKLGQGEPVKVKGLGTFKIIGVEARESVSVRTGERVVIDGHSKLSFTPDSTMKELVNKPFSQFETVVLNEGVEFDDVQELEPTAVEEPVVEEPVVEEPVVEEPVVEEPVVEEPVAEEPVAEEPVAEEPVAEEPVAEEPVAEEPSSAESQIESEPIADVSAVETVPVVEEPVVITPQFLHTENKATQRGYDDEQEEKKKPSVISKLLKVLGVLALMALSAYCGYYYGNNKPLPDVVPDTIYVRDSVSNKDAQAVKSDNSSVISAEQIDKTTEEVALKQEDKPAEEAVKPEEKAEKPAAKPESTIVKKEEAVDIYAQKDARVRLGAYRIVGLDHEVKVMAGQTFYSICRGNLGPDMECYVEVYNNLPSNPTIKEGQIIKIPKLELKRKRKK